MILFVIGMPLAISLFWRVLKCSGRNDWRRINTELPHSLENENLVDLSNFYYYDFKLNQSKGSEYFLCLLASSDLTFASLNPDLLFLKSTAAVLNMTKSVAFLLANIMIFIYYSNSISYINAITILILAPFPFIYKCITPRHPKNKGLISHGLK